MMSSFVISGGPDYLLSGCAKRTGGSLKMGALTLIALALTACGTCGPDQLGQIKTGMKPDQVEAILGAPARIDQSETTGVNGEVYHYPCANGEGRVVFLNNAVFKAEFVPGAKS